MVRQGERVSDTNKELAVYEIGTEFELPTTSFKLAPNIRTDTGLDDESLDELAASMRGEGQRTAVKCYANTVDDTGQIEPVILDGQRRFMAAMRPDSGITVLRGVWVERPENVAAYQLRTFDTAPLSDFERSRAQWEAWQTYPPKTPQADAARAMDCTPARLQRVISIFRYEDLARLWDAHRDLPASLMIEASKKKGPKRARGEAIYGALPSHCLPTWTAIYGAPPAAPDKPAASGERRNTRKLLAEMEASIKMQVPPRDAALAALDYAYRLGVVEALRYATGGGAAPLGYEHPSNDDSAPSAAE
jgi:hypothetical protein